MRIGQNMPPAFGFIFSLVIPTVFIFLILGFWHGASWTYVVFGGMHGLYVVTNHLWRKFFPLPNKKNKMNQSYKTIKMVAGWTLTFLAVNIASVMFRSDSISTAVVVYKGMLGFHGYSLGNMPDIQAWIFNLKIILLTMMSAFLIVFLMPNTIRIASLSEKIFTGRGGRSYIVMAILIGIIYALLQLSFYESPFLYFQF
jgi:alginate O-acetyltransferase complex protein AlgI